MAEAAASRPSLSDRLMDVGLVQAALARAVRRALLRHKQAGNPVAEWREGRVVWVAPEEIPAGPDGCA
jgi:hypothetical protein